MNKVLLGGSLAVVEGGLLTLWGISSKELAAEISGFETYALVLCLAGIGHLGLLFFFDKSFSFSLKKQKISRFYLILLGVFVLVSSLQFYLGVAIYEDEKADLSVSSFLRNASLPFVAILAHYAAWSRGVFKEARLNKEVVIGIILFLIASWLFVGAASFSTSFFSLWVLLSVLVGFNRAITELLMQRFAGNLTKSQLNISLGVGLIAVGVLFLLISPGWPALGMKGWIALFGVSLIIPLMQIFRYQALTYMNEVVAKKGITIWSYFVFSVLFGTLLYGEPITTGKVVALLIGLVAVVFLEKDFRMLIVRKLTPVRA